MRAAREIPSDIFTLSYRQQTDAGEREVKKAFRKTRPTKNSVRRGILGLPRNVHQRDMSARVGLS